jgi:hypothetical protein
MKKFKFYYEKASALDLKLSLAFYIQFSVCSKKNENDEG